MALDTDKPDRIAVVVLGCHRSGTSAMTRAIALCGAALPSNIMPPNPGNPTGYWEPLDVAAFNDRVLDSLDLQWRDVFGPPLARADRKAVLSKFRAEARELLERNYADADLIVLKDPRITWLWELWTTVLKDAGYEPRFIVMVRDPVEVAESLVVREGMSRNRSLLMWASYMLASDRASTEGRSVYVNFEDFLSDPEAALDRVERALGLVLPERNWETNSAIGRFLRPEVRGRVGLRKKALPPPLAPIDELFRHLSSAGRDAPENEDVPQRTASWLQALETTFGPVLGSMSLELKQAALRISELEESTKEVEALRQQLSTAAVAANELAGKCADLETLLVDRSEQAEAAEAQAIELRSELGLITAECQDAKTRAAQLESRLSEALLHTQEREFALESARATIDQLRQSAEALRQTADTAQGQAAELRSELDRVAAERENQAKAAVARAEALNAELNSREVQLIEVRRNLRKFEQALHEAETRTDRLDMEFASVVRARDLTEADLQKQLDDYRHQLQFAQERADSFRARAEAMQKELDAAQPVAAIPQAVSSVRPPELERPAMAGVARLARGLARRVAVPKKKRIARDLARNGDQARNQRDWPEAAASYQGALQYDPTMAHIWVQYGHALKEQGLLDQAESAYRRALALQPDNADTFLNLGHLLKGFGRLTEALRAYERAHALAPQNDDARIELAAIRRRVA